MNILVTGEYGFLASALIDSLTKIHNLIMYDHDVRYYKSFENIDIILHFASPSDRVEFTNREKVTTTIIDGTINMVNIAKENNAVLVFASTMGVYTYDIDDVYCSCKRAMEHYILSTCDRYVILRIPRVYHKTRDKGLMRLLRTGNVSEEQMCNNVEFLDLSEFTKQTVRALRDNTNQIFEYNNMQNKSVQEIKELYV
ncbi:hypothetical protein CL622_03665 [archaeon]|nr:hypothetical protein [archaeon]|tara:strand:+ start:866 stop:1459 length:594 start_codon:yes stop_codon:yes gene_type:complete